MLKSQRKSVLDKIISLNKLNSQEAKAAHMLQLLFLDEETSTSRQDPLSHDYIPRQHKISSLDDLMVFKDHKKKAISAYKRWLSYYKNSNDDPMALQISKAILHYNIDPLDIAKELTDQLYKNSKISIPILRNFNVRISRYQIEKIFKKSLSLYADLYNKLEIE